MHRRSAFTLLELLISIALLSLVLLALYQSLGMLRASNAQLFEHLSRANMEKKAIETLFLDIASSDGNITIVDDEFSRLCIEDTLNSLYELPSAKVCWVVSKKEKTLMRSEGNYYELPLGSEDRVAVDSVMKDIDLFRLYRKGGEVLVLLQQKGKESMSFMVHGVPQIIKKKKLKKPKPPKKVRPKPPVRGKPNTTPVPPIPKV